jgi:hypothetical protein
MWSAIRKQFTLARSQTADWVKKTFGWWSNADYPYVDRPNRFPLRSLTVPPQTLQCQPFRGPDLRCCQGRLLRARGSFLGRHVACGRFAALPSEWRVIRPATGGECSGRQLHGEDGAEPGLPLRNALVGLRRLSQWVRLDYRFNFALRHEIKSLVQIFGTVLLTSNDPNALHYEV